ncbi:MAG: hypothetical protein KGM42_05290 [Hyphomicrobiales bacterium]|nr:hypothetical protein [Hyphomicrobiales bacterium]
MEFCRVPRLLYSGMKGFSPSLDAERWTLHAHKLNPHYNLVRSQAFLAKRNGATVGRIEAQIYRDAKPNEASPAQFGSLDAINDPAVVAALLAAAETWLAGQGASVVVGPFSPSINAECGLLVQGEDAVPMIFMPWHPPYLAGLVEQAGYSKARDLISYRYDVSDVDRAFEPVLLNRPEWKERLKFRPLKLDDIKSEVALMTRLFNDAWSGNWGFVPITEAEFKSMADSLKFLMTPDYGFVIELDGEPVAFGIVIPNLHEIVADMDGRLGVTGIPKLVSRIRKMPYNSGRLALFGMKHELHKSARGGVVVLTMVEHMKLLSRKVALDHIEFGWVLENNAGMRKPIEMSGAKIDKIHRIYEKRLAGAPGANTPG